MSKLLILLTLLVTLHPISYSQSTDLFISEYVEGTSFNKALELYNGTGSVIDLAASEYIIQIYFNGSSSPSNIALSGIISDGNAFVIAHSTAVLGITPNQSSSNLSFNGDDAIVLRKGGASGPILDVIGQVGTDPGAEWGTGDASTADNTLQRKSTICGGNATTSDAFDPSSEWNGFSLNTFSNLGTHQATCTTIPGISITPDSAGFTMAAVQSYTFEGTGLTDDITVTAPSPFEVSLSPSGTFSSSVLIPSATANGAPVTIYLKYTPSGDSPSEGVVTHISSTYSKDLKVYGSVLGVIPIYEIQGSGDASPKVGNLVTTEGVVTGDFQGTGELGGFFIQAAIGDNNSETSDGIFILNTTYNVAKGNFVRLTGIVEESFGKTQIKSVSSLDLMLDNTPAMVNETAISLPVASTTDLERYEGMLVKFDQTLTVTEVYDLGRFGEVVLSANGRLMIPTNQVDPNDNPPRGDNSSGVSNLSEVTARQDLNMRSRIILDDNSSIQNPPTIPYVDPINNTLRVGSTMTNVQGIVDYSFGNYRIQPTKLPSITYAQRPDVPSVGNADMKVASFNVLNYFNGDGKGGGFPTPRGASNAEEFTRQRNKIIAAIKEMDADVIGLMEIENDGDDSFSAVADLVRGLNVATSSGTYDYILDPVGANGNPGTDAIKQAIIYRPAKVTPIGNAVADMNTSHDRPPVAQTFASKASNEELTVVVNHFKSKGCSEATGLDLDQGDGQSCYNEKRKIQASALLTFIENIQTTSEDQDVIVIGDLNAYEQEDPIDLLRMGGLQSLLANTYSYVFMGQSGSLDYALITSSLADKVSGAAKWHINADEPRFKDYNQEFNPSSYYTADPFRSSDHDPVIIGITSVVTSTNNSALPANINISPNPSSGLIHLEIQGPSQETLSLSVYSLIGEKLLATKIKSSSESKYDLDLSSLSSGIYFLKISDVYNSALRKIVISK